MRKRQVNVFLKGHRVMQLQETPDALECLDPDGAQAYCEEQNVNPLSFGSYLGAIHTLYLALEPEEFVDIMLATTKDINLE